MFETLTYAEQVARLTAAARDVLPAYGLDGAAVTLLMYVNNAVFRVETAGGEQYALRLARQGSALALESELRWLEALSAESALCVPRPVRTLTHDLTSEASVEGLAGPLHSALLAWVEGEPVAPADITPQQVERLGAFIAHLHQQSAMFRPVPPFERRWLDWDGLFGPAYHPGAAGMRLFSAEHLAVFAAVAERTRQVMAGLDGHFGLIHADLIAKNVLFRGETVCALDFDSCGYGYFLYDLAPPLLQFSDQARYPALKAALWAGYTRVRPLPETQRDDLETLVAARHVASCYWIAGNLANPRIRERAPQIIETRVGELRRFLETGLLERRSEIF